MSTGSCVVLVPGLWVTRASMLVLARRLATCGFRVRMAGYPSVRRDLAANAEHLAAAVEDLAGGGVGFVGHSLGGLVIREMLRRHPARAGSRVVTLGTPHNGSRVATGLWRFPPLRPLLGRSVGDLVRGASAHMGPAPPHLGCVAGSRPLGAGRLVVPGLEPPHDGTITVAEALLDGAEASITLPVSHTEMLFSARVAEAVGRFLRECRFGEAAERRAGRTEG